MNADAIKIDDIHMQVEGQGANSLLFVHGYCCAGEDWDTQIDYFKARYTCATLDLPGHGLSRTPAEREGNAMVLAAAAVNRVKQTLPGTVALISHSMGCKIIREAYRQDEAKVAGLVFVDGSLYIGRKSTVIEASRSAVANGMETFLHRLVHDMFPSGSDPAVVARVWQRAQELDYRFAQALFLDSVVWDMDQAVQTVRELDVPALAVQSTAFDSSFRWYSMGSNEKTPFMKVVETLAPAGKAVVLPGSGHFPMFDVPAELNAILSAFLDELPAFAR